MSGLRIDFIASLDGYGAARLARLVGLEGPEYLGWFDDSRKWTKRS